MLNTITFKDGERVVLPHHGVCTFSGLIKEEISGTTMEFAVIAVDRGIIKVPVTKLHGAVRKLSSEEEVLQALELLSESADKHGRAWWQKNFTKLFRVGEIISIATILRDSYPGPEKMDTMPHYIREFYRPALKWMSEEAALVLRKTPAEMVVTIEKKLGKRPKDAPRFLGAGSI